MMEPLKLIEAYLDNVITPEQEAELFQWMDESAEHRRLFLQELHCHCALREMSRKRRLERQAQSASVKEPVSDSRSEEALRSADASQPVDVSPGAAAAFQEQFTPESTGFPPQPVAPTAPSVWLQLQRFLTRSWVKYAVLVILVLGVLLVSITSYQTYQSVLLAHGADIQLLRQNKTIPLTRPTVLQPGDVLRTGPIASGIIQTRRPAIHLALDPGLELTVVQTKPAPLVQLHQGSLYATVTRRKPGQPLTLRTTHAEAKVLGTDLKLASTTNQTELHVYSGRVRLATLGTRGNASLPAQTMDITAGNRAVVTAQSGLQVEPLPPPAGYLLAEFWQPLPGNTMAELTNHVTFPDQPTRQQTLPAFELPARPAQERENYGARLRGYLHPPRTGEYTFWIAADDTGELWLSPTESPALKTRIAHTPEYTDPRQWDKHPQQQSRSVHLIAGRKYYFEALLKESGGGDHLAVAWQGPGLTQEVISGQYLSPPAN